MVTNPYKASLYQAKRPSRCNRLMTNMANITRAAHSLYLTTEAMGYVTRASSATLHPVMISPGADGSPGDERKTGNARRQKQRAVLPASLDNS